MLLNISLFYTALVVVMAQRPSVELLSFADHLYFTHRKKSQFFQFANSLQNLSGTLNNAIPAIGANGFCTGKLQRKYIPVTERRLSIAIFYIFIDYNHFRFLHSSVILEDLLITLWYLLLFYNEVYKHWKPDRFSFKLPAKEIFNLLHNTFHKNYNDLRNSDSSRTTDLFHQEKYTRK